MSLIDADKIFEEALNDILPVNMKQSIADVFLFPIVNWGVDPSTVCVNAQNGKKIKFHHNRRGDVNLLESSGEPDWLFRHGEYEIRMMSFTGKHPRIMHPVFGI